MNTNLLLSLEITALGMGLVFSAIILLWGMMAVLTALTADKETELEDASSPLSASALRHAQDNASDSAEAGSSPQADSKLQVALLAVAMALAEQGQSSAHPLEQPPTAFVSAWQLGMRTRQMSEKGNQPRLRKS